MHLVCAACGCLDVSQIKSVSKVHREFKIILLVYFVIVLGKLVLVQRLVITFLSSVTPYGLVDSSRGGE